MSQVLQKLLKRIDAMSLRERMLLFACVVALLGGLTDYLFVAPLLKQQKMVARKIDQQSAAMDSQRVRVQIELMKSARDRANRLNAEIARADEEIVAVEQEIQAISKAGGEAAVTMLAKVLGKTDKVTLVRVAPLDAERAASGISTRNGLDITLSGAYLDLMKHLSTLEKAVPNARWGAVNLNANAQPTVLTVRVSVPLVGT